MDGQERLLELSVYLPQHEYHKGDAADDHGRNDVRGLPGIDTPAPAQTEQKHEETGDKENNADVVQIFQLLDFAAILELFGKRRRVVKEEEESTGAEVDYDHGVIAPNIVLDIPGSALDIRDLPSPPRCRVQDECFRDRRTKSGEWNAEEVHDSISREPMLDSISS